MSEKVVEIEKAYGELNLELMQEFTDANGISGNEKAATRVMKKWLEGIADEFSYDNLGSLIALKKGSGDGVKLMLAGHIDEIGFVVRHIDDKGFLTTVTERTHIERKDGKIQYKDAENYWFELEENTPVSMNMWGFTPDYFEHSAKYFIKFLELEQNNLKSEYFIPLMVDHLIKNKTADVKVLDTTSKWFGVTYAEDRESVVAKLQALADSGEYPTPLWK